MNDITDLITDSHSNSMTATPSIVFPSQPTQNELPAERPKEIGGPKGLEPTRYGDWEKAGRCIDF